MSQTVEPLTNVADAEDRARRLEWLQTRRDVLLKEVQAVETEMLQLGGEPASSARFLADPETARYFTPEFTRELLGHFAEARNAAIQ